MSSDNILVAIKSRPYFSKEESEKLRPQWIVQEKAIFQVDEDGHRLGEPYIFDHIFSEHITNSGVYSSVVEPLVQSFLNGFNSTIFAYGQTASGKTHTMMGTDDIPGVMQLAISDVFKHVSHNTQRRYLLSCSYFEIYNEKINDLLDKNGHDLKIREDFCGNTFVNAKEEVVTQQGQVFDLMKVGSKIRKIGCTNVNERSSRSHSIFRFTIKSTENNIEHGPVQISHLNLVDLAGSERIAHTKAAGVRLKEGVNINKSLLALGNVIRQLSEGEGFINYRDSNLTRLLQHALGGNAKSLIIATITMLAGEETKSTLEFAQRAKVIKNKPIINEILSEQVKLKQYELATACYKERLEKEQQRIQEMEHEKEEREREISKLKQQVKLIDLFTNGPIKKPDSKIPRRHTMGHYTARIPLQTIPESRVLSTNIMEEKDDGNFIKCEEEEEDELLFKSISQESDYDYLKTTIEECLEEGILAITPEPLEEGQIKEETTPSSHLRERLKHLEESYISLQEFTKLETECKEDKSILYELTKEKENLLKDVIDLNAMIKEIRQENEKLKMQSEDQHSSLKKDIDFQRRKCQEIEFALEQSEIEKDSLRLAKEQLLNDNAFVLEQQKLKYEKQIQYFVDEIDRLNKQGKDDAVDYNFEEEIKKLKKENENFQLNVERIATYEEKIAELEQKLEGFENKEDEDFNALSVATQMEDTAVSPNVNEEIETELTDITKETILQKECDELKENIHKLNDKLENIQSLNLILEEELRGYKLKSPSYLETKTNNETQKDISKKQEEINSLLAKLGNLENENQCHKNKIDSQAEDINLKNEKISELTNNVKDLQKDIQNNEKKIKALHDQIEKLEKDGQSQSDRFILQTEEIKSKNATISDLNAKIDLYQKLKQDLEEQISLYKEQMEATDGTITDLTNKIENLGVEYKKYNDDIDTCKLELHSKTIEFNSQTEKIIRLETDNHKYEKELERNIMKIHEQEKLLNAMEKEVDEKVKALQDELTKFETENKTYKEELATIKKESIYKDDEMMVLSSKLDAIQIEQASNVADLVLYKEEMEAQINEISVLENTLRKLEIDNDDYKQEINTLKQELVSKEREVAKLTEKIDDLEKTNRSFVEDVTGKEDLIQQIERLREENKTHTEVNMNLKEEIHIKNQAIAELNNTVANLETINQTSNADIQLRDDRILKLTDQNKEIRGTYQNEISSKELKIAELQDKIGNMEVELQTKVDRYKNDLHDKVNRISELNNTIKNLEKCSNDNKQEIEMRNNRISELTDIIKDLEVRVNKTEEDVEIKERQISKLTNDITNLTKCRDNLKEKIEDKENRVTELSNMVKDLEKTIHNNREEIQIREQEISKLTGKTLDLEKVIHGNEKQIQIQEKEISDLKNKEKALEKCIHNNKEEINSREKQISELSKKVMHLEKNVRNNEREIRFKDDQILKLTKTAKDMEMSIHSNKEEIKNRDSHIFELKKQITCLEYSTYTSGEDVKVRDSQISELRTTIQNLEIVDHSKDEEIIQLSDTIQNLDDEIVELKNDIESKDDTISKLKARVKKLDEDCHNYENEVSQCKEEIFLQERKIRDLTKSSTVKGIQHKSAEDYNKEDTIQDLNIRISNLVADKKKLEQLMGDMSMEKDKEKIKNRELENRIRNLYMETVALRTRIFDLENVITELKSGAFSRKFESKPSRRSPSRNSSTSSSTELSPKEVRRRKRQSIHDQRRGIDLSATGTNDDGNQAAAETAPTEEDLKAKIKRLKSTVDHLSQENDSLEYEVRGFMGELSDYKKYNEEKDKEIEALTEQIEKLKRETGQEDCKECPLKLHHIKKLEELQKQNKFKIVELQTTYYDLQNRIKEEITNSEEKERRLRYHIAKLETKLGESAQPEFKDADIQCDIMNLQELLEKYSKVKKLARMRREEANILRGRLGMDSDEPVQ